MLALGIIGAIVSGSAANHPNAVAPKPAPSTSAPASHPAASPVATAPAAIPNPLTILKKIHGVVIPKGEVTGTYGIIGTDTRLAQGSAGNGSLAVYTGSSTADVVQAVALPSYRQDGEYIITGPDFLIEYQVNRTRTGATRNRNPIRRQ